MLIILLLTLVRAENETSMEYPHFEKVIHLFSFCALSFCMIVGFTKQDTYSRLRFEAPRYAVFISIGYACLIELIQFSISRETFGAFDLLSKSLGSLVGYFLFVFMYRVLK